MKKIYLMVLFLIAGVAMSNAQTQISGTVVDESGNPVIGASIVVKGTQIGVMSGQNGRFTLTPPTSNATLQVSFIGYQSTEVPATPNVRIVLTSTSMSIDDVVVTGVTPMDRRMFTGATDRLVAEDVKLDGVPDISRALEGRSAGVSVQNVSATFGTAPKIRVRGATSILGDSKPLWVLDGVIIEDVTEVSADQLSSGDAVTLISSAVAGLNADDIESFQILKDGSATSIYGARAMAGVIVITTKRGRAGVTRINYTGEFTTRLIPSYNDYNIMNSQDQMGIYQELHSKGFLNYAETYRASNSGVYGRMYQLMNGYNPATGMFDLPATSVDQNAYLREAEYRNTDWFKKLFQNSISMTHSISVSSGSEKSTSYLSMSLMDDPGWYKQSKVSRYTFNANTTYNLRQNLSVTLLGNASYRRQRAPGTLAQNVDVVNGLVSRDFDINPFSYAMNTSRTLDPNETYTRNYAGFNIMDELQNNYIDLNIIEAKFQGELKWDVNKDLRLSALAAVRYQTTSQQHNIMDNSNQANAYRAMDDATIRDANAWLYKDPDSPNTLPISILPNGGIMEKREYSAFNYDFRASAVWNKTFESTHHVNLNGHIELNQIRRKNDWFRGMGLQYMKGSEPFFTYLAFKQMNEDRNNYYTTANTIRKNVAFIANGTYSYMMKYTINGTFRYEGTNRMGKSNTARWLPTWNISGAWVVDQENFFKKQDVMSHLKLRASYSLTADAGPDFVTNSTHIINSYTPWRPIADDREPGMRITYIGNEDLTYEKKHEFNVGLDMGFLDNRLNLTVDYYTRNNFDLIGMTNTEGVSGEIRRYANIADMKSSGFEATISTLNLQKGDFRWNTDFTFGYNKNEITKLQPDARVIDLIVGTGYNLEGYARGSLFSIPYLGLDDEGLPMFMFNNKLVTKDNYNDINFQLTNPLDWLVHEGPTEPKIQGGFGNVFTYKNWRLNIFMTYAFGGKVRLNPIFKNRYTDLDATPKEFKNRWMTSGDELFTDVPTIADRRQNRISGIAAAYNAYNYSSARIAKADFIRMKEISLTYDLPKQWLSAININSMSIRLQSTNPFLIYADKALYGQDPEYYQSGGVSSPLAKQFTMTIRIGF